MDEDAILPHPVDLPTLLPPGAVRRSVISARASYHHQRLRRRWAGAKPSHRRLGFADLEIVRQGYTATGIAGDASVREPEKLPEDCAYWPIWKEYTKPGRHEVQRRIVGHLIYDLVHRTYVFNLAPGIPQGSLPMIVKLSADTFLSFQSGTLYLFSDGGKSCQLLQSGSIKGPRATRIVRILEELAAREARKWDKLFDPDIQKANRRDKTVPPSKRRSGKVLIDGRGS